MRGDRKMYQVIRKHELHLSQKVTTRTIEFGRVCFSILTDELSRTHGIFRYATQIHGDYELNQRLKAGFVQYYNTEEEAKSGHHEIIRKMRNGEFQFIPEMYRLVIAQDMSGKSPGKS